MHRYARDTIALIQGVVATFVLSLIPFPILPEWTVYGLPLPWQFLFTGARIMYVDPNYNPVTYFFPSLVLDLIFWVFIFHKLLLRYFLMVISKELDTFS